MLTRVTETAAGDIEPAHSRGHRRRNENQDERSQDRQPTTIKKPKDQGDTAKKFQPWQIKREWNVHEPWKGFVIVDVVRELDRI